MTNDFAVKMMKKFGWEEGKGLGKEEDGRVRPVQVDQKLNEKGIGFGTEGAFAPWWDDLYNKTVMKTSVVKVKKLKENKEKKNKKKKKDKKVEKVEKVKKLILNDTLKDKKHKRKEKNKMIEHKNK